MSNLANIQKVHYCDKKSGNNAKYEDEQPEYISYTCLIMKDGTRKEFKDLKKKF